MNEDAPHRRRKFRLDELSLKLPYADRSEVSSAVILVTSISFGHYSSVFYRFVNFSNTDYEFKLHSVLKLKNMIACLLICHVNNI